MQRIPPKKLHDICAEWDNICTNRQAVIESGKDISLRCVTAPCILKKISELSPRRVLDIGCGTGYIASLIAKQAGACWGIDISENSIAIAKRTYNLGNLHFLNTAVADYYPTFQFDVCVSNLVFTSEPDWISSVKKINSLLTADGYLLIMITHPCFWPMHWGYNNESWYKYDEEIFIEHDFSLSLVKSIGKTTYIHRPLAAYTKGILSSGFDIIEMIEPYPTESTPPNYAYDYPRFLFLCCQKKTKIVGDTK